jgi:hypothetical protein
MGGFGYGLLLKTFPNLPTLPLLGRSGTVAAAVYLQKPKTQWIQDIGIAAAGNSFGATGTVSGDDDGTLASQT